MWVNSVSLTLESTNISKVAVFIMVEKRITHLFHSSDSEIKWLCLVKSPLSSKMFENFLNAWIQVVFFFNSFWVCNLYFPLNKWPILCWHRPWHSLDKKAFHLVIIWSSQALTSYFWREYISIFSENFRYTYSNRYNGQQKWYYYFQHF